MVTPFQFLASLGAAALIVFGIRWWTRRFSQALVPDGERPGGTHELQAVADEISPEDLSVFETAEEVCFSAREMSHVGPRFFWVFDRINGRLHAQALFIALGIRPADLVEVFGFAPGSDGTGVRHWDDLGSIPLKAEGGRYNTSAFERLAAILEKDIHVFFEAKIGDLNQEPTPLFVARRPRVAISV